MNIFWRIKNYIEFPEFPNKMGRFVRSRRTLRTQIGRVYVGDQIVTRSKKTHLRAHRIKCCFVGLNPSLGIKCLTWLDAQKPNGSRCHQLETSTTSTKPPKNQPLRRASVAGYSLYSVNNRIMETGSDHLLKIPRIGHFHCNGSQGALGAPKEPTNGDAAHTDGNMDVADVMNKERGNFSCIWNIRSNFQ